MERWDLYDINREKTGKTMLKGKEIPDDLYRLVVHVCVFNSHGEMLIQKRVSTKKDFADMWDISACGSAIAGEDGAAAAERELFEETGIKVSFCGKRPSLTVDLGGNVFDDFYLAKKDVSADELSLQVEEVSDARWASEKEILNLIGNGKFVPYHSGLVELLFDINANDTAINRKNM